LTTTDTHRAIEAVWRIESAKLIASLARIVRDIGLAEDLAQDALVIALEQWPETGIPNNPGAWLMATAKHRAIDRIRRNATLERKVEVLGRALEIQQAMAEVDLEAALDDDVGDDLLRLIFTACHPVLSIEARVALTLRLLGGLTTEEIAHAFLVPEATVAQRIVRAKRTLAEARVPFDTPRGAERAARLSSVLEVIYLIFNEGYAATSGDHWTRPALCEDALRLGRILAELMPNEPEVHGLVALMELQASRLRARVGSAGEPILLLDQNRARWDQLPNSRGALFPALLSLGLSAVQIRRSSQAVRAGAWSSDKLVTRWRAWVAAHSSWQPGSYAGYQPLALDITTFGRPRLHGWLGKFFSRLAERAVKGIGFTLVVQVGHCGVQRLPLLKQLICAHRDTLSESQFKATVLKTAGQSLAAHEVVVHDAGASIADMQTAKVPRYVVRLDRNCTARRNQLPPNPGGQGRPAEYGTRVRPLARTYKDHHLPATPPDVTVQFTYAGRLIDAQG